MTTPLRASRCLRCVSGHTESMRTFLGRARFALLVLTGGGPALLTDWNNVVPAHVRRWMLVRLGLDPANVCEWMCEFGLCPCGSSVDAEEAPAAAVVAS